MPSFRILAHSFALFVAGTLSAQTPPGSAPPADVAVLDAIPATNGPADIRWRAGKDALAKGEGAAAVPHLLAALEFHPDAPAVLLDLWLALDDPGAKALWLERFVRAASDAQGRLKLDESQRKLLGKVDLRSQQKLAEARALAATELLRIGERLKPTGKDAIGNGALARWLCEAFLDLASDAPALLRQHGRQFTAILQRHAAADWLTIAAALAEVAQKGIVPQPKDAAPALATQATARPTPELAQRAARLLQGLIRQSGFGKDLQGGPAPDLSKYAATAAAAANAAGTVLAAPKVWSIDELKALTVAQSDEFTLAHRLWQNPGVALSTTGKYRVETICGRETLLGVAATAELHHARLVAHFGKEPFEGRIGTIRIVPDVNDLEIEGSPFWWAAGFQGGDRTVLRFAWGGLASLGHGLTHELTHRFDGVLHPFVGAWYTEGHATWTAGHYAKTSDTQFVEDHLDSYTCAHVYALGYGNREKFESLLLGKLADYRDNYPAGYSLYSFLRGYPPKQTPRYRAALRRFEMNARGGGKDPLAYFTSTFCDGKDGRPANFDEFFEEWQKYLSGCYQFLDERTRGKENQWVASYGPLGEGEPSPLVLDEPTWSWSRNRAEPFFGQGHAAEAGAVLASSGMPVPAALAYLASLQCEGISSNAVFAAADLLQSIGCAGAASAVRQLGRNRFPMQAHDLVPTPLLPQLPRTKAYLDLLAQTATGLAQGNCKVAAGALFAEHERIATRLCLLESTTTEVPLAPVPVPRTLASYGWVEDALTGFDDKRVPGCWYATPEGDLHVGREKPKETTGTLDRAAHVSDCFARSSDWVAAGDYVVKMRVHFTTSYVSGAIVLGHWRRDRDLRLSFAAGDYMYAIGRSEKNEQFKSVYLGFAGLWERDGQLPGTAPSQTIALKAPASFELELCVRGPLVLVKVDGEVVFRYTMPDGSPIEGSVGFAMHQGAIRVQQPTVGRQDIAQRGQAISAVEAIGLDLARPTTVSRDDLVHLRVKGIPTCPVGTLVLWVPQKNPDDEAVEDIGRYLPELAKLLRDTVQFPQAWQLAVPAGTTAAELQLMALELGEYRTAPLPVIEHRVGAPLTGAPSVLFIDATGILRAIAEIGEPTLYSSVQRWARMFRAR
jgi:hypothetical protein